MWDTRAAGLLGYVIILYNFKIRILLQFYNFFSIFLQGRTWRRSGLTSLVDSGMSGISVAEVVNHADIKTTRKYLAKSIRTHQQVAEGIFGSNENTRSLTVRRPMGQVADVASDVPSRIRDTLLNSSNLAVRYRCILAAARYQEDKNVDLAPYCRPELSEKSDLPNRKALCFVCLSVKY